jgi:antitoxin component YwqK of YwqJK toxin-antitoxin module
VIAWRAIAAGAALAVVSACLNVYPSPPPGWRTGETKRAPVSERRRTYYDNAATRMRTETQVLILEKGRFEKHGRETEFFEDGTIASQHEFEHGEPTGTWKSWYPSGAKRSECSFTEPPTETEMFWWYENGSLETRGPAINGLRAGVWTHWYPSGAKESEGRYVFGRRDGIWTSWNEDGSVRTEIEYRAGVRVKSLENPSPSSQP